MSWLLFQSLTELAPKYMLEQFLESELVVNITEHSVRYCLILLSIL